MVGLGELLWDLLPSGKVLGGAPANFAYMATVLGNQGAVASRVGNDDLGRQASQSMKKLGLNTHSVQLDNEHQTGTAQIELDHEGQPQFTIKTPAAWDFLEWTPAWQQVSQQTDVVCFGSLAQRSPCSASTIERFLASVPESTLRICDANLREPFFTSETLRRSFLHADIVKVNSAELQRISTMLNLKPGSESQLAKALLMEFDLRLVCVTRGGQGSLIVSRERAISHDGFPIKVADTVGAGDAFTACLAHYYVRGVQLEEISERANRFGAWVASQTGATPEIQDAELNEILRGNF